MKIYICFALLIFMVTPSLAEVNKCKVNGKLVYSQISCADDAVKMNIIRYTPPTPEDIYKQELAAQQGELDKQKQAQDDQNARRRYAENVLLAPPIEHDLLGRKAQREAQDAAAAFLGIDRQRRSDKTNGGGVEDYTVFENGRTKNCQKSGNQVTCQPIPTARTGFAPLHF